MKAIKFIAAMSLAIAATGCAGYKQQGLVGYEGITYNRTAEAVAAMDGCVQELKDDHNVAVVLVPDSITIDAQRAKQFKEGKKAFVKSCMSEQGFVTVGL